MSNLVSRGHLAVQTDPPRMYWKADELPITVAQSHILYKLVREGSMSNTALTQHVHGDTNALRTCMSSLRRRLPPGVNIVSRKGWGYVLKIEEDKMDVRKQVADAVPEDAKGAVLIVLGADNKAVSTAVGVTPGGAVVLLSVAMRGVGDRLIAMTKPVDETASAD